MNTKKKEFKEKGNDKNIRKSSLFKCGERKTPVTTVIFEMTDLERSHANITSWRLIRVNKFIKNGVANEIEGNE